MHWLPTLCAAWLAIPSLAPIEVPETTTLRVYLNADMSHNRHSGYSIELGIRSALQELGGTLGGCPVELVVLDHRGNSRRSMRNVERVAADPNALAMFGGMHSPPLLGERGLLQEEEMLTLLTWAAAGPLTRTEEATNWAFRVSVDDTTAGMVLAHHATQEEGSSRPHLLLERTGWGRSNERTLLASLRELGIEDAPVHWFEWGIGKARARHIARDIRQRGADAVILVANAPEASVLVEALGRGEGGSADVLPIVSHWGVMGGALTQLVPEEAAERVRLSILQTIAVRAIRRPDQRVAGILQRARRGFPKLLIGGRISAEVGYGHAFDMTLLLDAAVRQVQSSGSAEPGSIRGYRRAVRDSLENLTAPVPGILRTYVRPFAPPSEGGSTAHEALRGADLEVFALTADGRLDTDD